MTSVDDLDLTARLRREVDAVAAQPAAPLDVATVMRRGRRRRIARVQAPRAVLAAAAVAGIALGVPQVIGANDATAPAPAASASRPAPRIGSTHDLAAAMSEVLADHDVATTGLVVAVVPKPAGTWVAKVPLKEDGARLEVTVSRTSALPPGQEHWKCPGEFPCHTSTAADGTVVTTISSGVAMGDGGASESFLSETLADVPGGGQVRVVVSSIDPYGSGAHRPQEISEAVQEAIAADPRLRA